MYLLDTVVLSELRKKPLRRNPHVVSWLASVSSDDLFISAVSIGEIERGIERQPIGLCWRAGRVAGRRSQELW